jgi:hypothetical protein
MREALSQKELCGVRLALKKAKLGYAPGWRFGDRESRATDPRHDVLSRDLDHRFLRAAQSDQLAPMSLIER